MLQERRRQHRQWQLRRTVCSCLGSEGRGYQSRLELHWTTLSGAVDGHLAVAVPVADSLLVAPNRMLVVHSLLVVGIPSP